MKVYVSKKNDKRKYIKNVKDCNDGSLEIKFADGRVFKNIERNEENIKKINKVQEEQARKGLDNYVVFKNRFIKAIVYLGCSGLATGLVLATTLTSQMTPVELFTGLGVINVFGTIPSFCKLIRNKLKMNELDKVSYRDNNIDKLKNYKKYENSLVGLDSCTSNYFNESSPDDAFAIVNVDKYEKSDLETIVSNIDSEESLGFTYVKKKDVNNQNKK